MRMIAVLFGEEYRGGGLYLGEGQGESIGQRHY